MATHEDELIARARELQRLLTQRRKLRRQLRLVELDVRHVRKMLNALKAASQQRRPDAAPNRLTAGVTAIGVMPEEPRPVDTRVFESLLNDDDEGGTA
jgi:phage shock protein A